MASNNVINEDLENKRNIELAAFYEYDTDSKKKATNDNNQLQVNNEQNAQKTGLNSDANNNTNAKPTGKKKLQPIKLILPVVGGAAAIALIMSGTKKVKEVNYEHQYQNLLNNNDIRTSSMYDLVNENATSLDELLDTSSEQYANYERFRSLLSAKKQFLDPKEYKLKEYNSFDYDYDRIDPEHLNELNDLYYDYFNQMERCHANNDQEGYDIAAAQFDGICVEMNSIRLSIDEYSKEHGAPLVEDIANKVLVSKVIDEENLDPNKVSDIRGIYKANGDLSISFEYQGDSYNRKFTDDKEDKIENLARDLANENLLDAIHETKVFAADNDYEGMKKGK